MSNPKRLKGQAKTSKLWENFKQDLFGTMRKGKDFPFEWGRGIQRETVPDKFYKASGRKQFKGLFAVGFGPAGTPEYTPPSFEPRYVRNKDILDMGWYGYKKNNKGRIDAVSNPLNTLKKEGMNPFQLGIAFPKTPRHGDWIISGLISATGNLKDRTPNEHVQDIFYAFPDSSMNKPDTSTTMSPETMMAEVMKQKDKPKNIQDIASSSPAIEFMNQTLVGLTTEMSNDIFWDSLPIKGYRPVKPPATYGDGSPLDAEDYHDWKTSPALLWEENTSPDTWITKERICYVCNEKSTDIDDYAGLLPICKKCESMSGKGRQYKGNPYYTQQQSSHERVESTADFERMKANYDTEDYDDDYMGDEEE